MKDLVRFWVCCMVINAFLVGAAVKLRAHLPPCDPPKPPVPYVAVIAMGPLLYAMVIGYTLTEAKGPVVQAEACR